jgi:hypothetical protein
VCALLVPAFASGAEYENFRSQVQSVSPAVPGLELAVVRGDEGLQLRNKSDRTVVVEGYDGEPYLRFKPGGVVEANQRSAATYINVDRFGLQEVPDNALPGAKPRWKQVASDGSYTWFDHRIHLTAKRPPARFTRQKKLTKIFDWKVPMTVDGRRVLATGTLVWDPSSSSEGGGFPVWLGILIAVGVGLSLLLLARRRSRSPTSPKEEPAREAW